MSSIKFCNAVMNDRYTIVGRYMDGVKVLGYHLIDSNGRGYAVRKELVEQMALEKAITNSTAQRYKDGIVMKGIGKKLSELPVVDVSNGKLRGEEANNKKKQQVGKYYIIARLIKGKVTLGYVLKNEENEEKRVKRDDVLRLAREGKIINARAQMYKDELLLRGVGFELAQLPTIKVS